MKKLRGTAMIHTLALISLVLLAAFALATSSLSQLNLSSRYAQRTQADYTARAAMTEFVVRARAMTGKHDVTSPPDPIFPKFVGREVLLEKQARVDGYARLQLAKCVDNSGNPLPARSAFDSAGKTSVPPFCLSVVYDVKLGSRSYLYESLVQQRWPYALVAPGPVLIPGRVGPAPDGSPDETTLPQAFWSAPSEVKGRVLALQTDVTSDIDEHRSGETHAGNLVNPIKISMAAYQALYPYAYSGGMTGVPVSGVGSSGAGAGLNTGGASSTIREESDSRLILGGGYKIFKLVYAGFELSEFINLGSKSPLLRKEVTPPYGFPPQPPGGMGGQGIERGAPTDTKLPPQGDGSWQIQTYNVTTKGAIVHRGVDLLENSPPSGDGFTTQEKVTIKEGNKLNGKARYDYWLNGQDPAAAPARERMRELFTKPDTAHWPVNNFLRAKEIIIGKDPAPGVLKSESGLSTPPIYVRAETGKIRYQGNFEPSGYDLSTAAGQDYSAYYAQYFHLPEGYNVQGSLTLQDVSLSVDGNLSLQNYVLRGSKATLIVDGTLTLDGGYLDAGDNGLVIFCRRLIMKSQGNFNGLIVAEKGAALYGAGAAEPPGQPGLHIKGGLLIGGTDLLVKGDPTLDGASSPPQSMLTAIEPLQMRGLMLSSCYLEYAPQYLRGLNNFGNFEVLATELRQ
ncbi:MAG: hypothetical protein KF760_18525 [Candidatus Eremiobacteraeota bacterium]|nr:hypothetical protein [Candidatus Eremiobacteraeota bacterium]MCW5867351.1 hypothetical protein [Candidatus Eremiobacteraeota bacterium]